MEVSKYLATLGTPNWVVICSYIHIIPCHPSWCIINHSLKNCLKHPQQREENKKTCSFCEKKRSFRKSHTPATACNSWLLHLAVFQTNELSPLPAMVDGGWRCIFWNKITKVSLKFHVLMTFRRGKKFTGPDYRMLFLGAGLLTTHFLENANIHGCKEKIPPCPKLSS